MSHITAQHPEMAIVFFHAIVEQIHRATVHQRLPEYQRYTDIGELRKAVIKFMRNMKPDSPFFQIVHNIGMQNILPQNQNQRNMGGDHWQTFLANQEKNAAYAE